MKKLNANVEKIYLVQSEGEPDMIVFALNAPSPVPGDDTIHPAFFAGAAEGYGGTWLQEAFGLQPDEVINADKQDVPPELDKLLCVLGF